MTKEYLITLLRLFEKREQVLERLAALKNNGPLVKVSFPLDRGYQRHIDLPASYIAAQWTAEVIDIERKIKAAGGTL